MEIRALRYFVEVVRQQSFTAASKALFVTQPTVSKMLRVLEEELGLQLLVRDQGSRKRRVIPTDAGQKVFAHAKEMLACEASLKQDLDALGELRAGQLTIGIPPVGATMLAPAISLFHRQWPGVELKFFESGSHGVEAALRADDVEIGVLLGPLPDDFDSLLISDRPLYLVAEKQSRWRHHKKVPLRELAGERFLLGAETFLLNEVIHQACRQVGFIPTVACRSGQWDFIVAMVENGMGIAILPEPYGVQIDRNRFVSIPIVEPEIPWNLVMGWRRAAYLSRAARAWIDTCRTYFANASANSKLAKSRAGKRI
jgi:DNA-binding transcriptional LysR family regulator